MNENNSVQVLRGELELHLESATAQHLNLVRGELTRTSGDLNGLQEQVNDLKKKNGERFEALQSKVNAVEGKLEKEIQIFKEESRNLHAAFEEKSNDSRKEFEERINAVERQLEKEVQMLKVELKNLDAGFEQKKTDLSKEFEERADVLSKQFEGRLNIIQKEDKERCEALEKEMNALRRQHEDLKEEREKEVDALQKELATCKKKVVTLESVVNTNRNERAVNEQQANNQARELEERVRNITEELDRVNWNTKLIKIGLGGRFYFCHGENFSLSGGSISSFRNYVSQRLVMFLVLNVRLQPSN